MNLKVVFYLILASLCFGIAPVAVKYLTNLGVDTAEIILATALLLVFTSFVFLIFQKNKIQEIPRQSWKEILIITILATSVGTAGLIYTQQFTSAINLAFLMKLSVAFVPVIAFLVLREIHSVWKYSVMLLSFFGAFLLTTEGKMITANIGDIIVIGIAAILSYTNVLAKKVSRRVDAFLVSGIRLFIGNLLLLFLIFIFGTGFISLFSSYPFQILVIVGCSFGVVFFLYKGIELSTASEGTAFFLLSAPISFALAYFFLGEILTPIQLLGGALILFSCYLLRD